MADPHFQPIPDDPSAATIAAMFNAGDDWLLTADGDYKVAAVQTFLSDGSGFQEMVVLEWPVRHNHSRVPEVVRLMISPEDALGLAEAISHPARWLRARAIVRGQRDN